MSGLRVPMPVAAPEEWQLWARLGWGTPTPETGIERYFREQEEAERREKKGDAGRFVMP